ncbi:hypothetical protein ATK78_3688 [Pedobacter metabolipauper]|uniref:Uncharacterized protein n=1 Tax=Pedobacter metabolipauper TaxID=425513 RepID=A0A4R6SSJ8_9SPHI|nr:hypothetical protein ATK78_3688 [Pedobacter metabolipauper]
MLSPENFKRNYRYKSDKRKDRISYIIAIIISVIAFILIWKFV